MELCSPNTVVRYELKNTLNNTSMGQKGEINQGWNKIYKNNIY